MLWHMRAAGRRTERHGTAQVDARYRAQRAVPARPLARTLRRSAWLLLEGSPLKCWSRCFLNSSSRLLRTSSGAPRCRWGVRPAAGGAVSRRVGGSLAQGWGRAGGAAPGRATRTVRAPGSRERRRAGAQKGSQGGRGRWPRGPARGPPAGAPNRLQGDHKARWRPPGADRPGGLGSEAGSGAMRAPLTSLPRAPGCRGRPAPAARGHRAAGGRHCRLRFLRLAPCRPLQAAFRLARCVMVVRPCVFRDRGSREPACIRAAAALRQSTAEPFPAPAGQPSQHRLPLELHGTPGPPPPPLLSSQLHPLCCRPATPLAAPPCPASIHGRASEAVAGASRPA